MEQTQSGVLTPSNKKTARRQRAYARKLKDREYLENRISSINKTFQKEKDKPKPDRRLLDEMSFSLSENNVRLEKLNKEIAVLKTRI